MARFVIVVVMAGIVTIGGSLLWPKFMARKEPVFLGGIHDAVVKTPVGAALNNVLGASDGRAAAVSFQTAVASVAGAAINTVGQKIQEVVVMQAATQLVHQYGQLPSSDQQKIQQMICKPQGQ